MMKASNEETNQEQNDITKVSERLMDDHATFQQQQSISVENVYSTEQKSFTSDHLLSDNKKPDLSQHLSKGHTTFEMNETSQHTKNPDNNSLRGKFLPWTLLDLDIYHC